MASIPQSHADLFDKKSFANLARSTPTAARKSRRSGGIPTARILINTAKGA
jgi:hypothetical protein